MGPSISLPQTQLYNKWTWPCRSLHLYSLGANCVHDAVPVSGRTYTTVNPRDQQRQQQPPLTERSLVGSISCSAAFNSHNKPARYISSEPPFLRENAVQRAYDLPKATQLGGTPFTLCRRCCRQGPTAPRVTSSSHRRDIPNASLYFSCPTQGQTLHTVSSPRPPETLLRSCCHYYYYYPTVIISDGEVQGVM